MLFQLGFLLASPQNAPDFSEIKHRPSQERCIFGLDAKNIQNMTSPLSWDFFFKMFLIFSFILWNPTDEICIKICIHLEKKSKCVSQNSRTEISTVEGVPTCPLIGFSLQDTGPISCFLASAPESHKVLRANVGKQVNLYVKVSSSDQIVFTFFKVKRSLRKENDGKL